MTGHTIFVVGDSVAVTASVLYLSILFSPYIFRIDPWLKIDLQRMLGVALIISWVVAAVLMIVGDFI